MVPDPQPDADIEAESQRQKTALLYRNSEIVLGVTIVNASVLAYVNTTLHASANFALVWWSILVFITAGRFLLTRRFLAASPGAAAAPRWRRRYIAGTALAAATWTAGTVVFVWHAPDGARLFTGLVVAGMVAGAIPTLSPVPAAFRIFTLPVLVPLAAAILLQADSALGWAFGSMVVIFLAAVMLSARYLHEMLDVSIRLGLTQGRLAAQLEQARDIAEAALAERKRAVVTLGASEERSRIILQYSPIGILHYNHELVVTYCNDRISRILRIPREELLGFDMKTFGDQRVFPALRAAIDGKEGAYEGEFVLNPQEAHVWVAWSCIPFHSDLGKDEGGIAFVEDITERRRTEDEIRNLAYYDPLTRLPNRRLMMDRLGHAMTASNRSRAYGALMILDLDHFKSINDTQGHDIGDRLLLEVAQRLAACLRQGDTVSRLGGDEYVVLLEAVADTEQVAATNAENVAEKIRLAINLPYVLGGNEAEYFYTTSIGVTLFCGLGDAAETLLKQADLALYQAKASGRNAVRFFNPVMQLAIETRTN